jgi:hypothetical protein
VQSGNATHVKTLSGYHAPYWIRVSKKGNTYTSYVSADGKNWNVMGAVTLALGANPYTGIAYTTHDNQILDTARVDNITFTSDMTADNIINFAAKNIDEKSALLNWTTTTESNNDHFEIERSAVNSDFVKIGSIQGNGTTATSVDYTFNDLKPLAGANFYRLKEVNKNGRITYSSVVTVQFNFKKIQIFPNPAANRIYIRNNKYFNNGDVLKIQLIDFSGRVLYQHTSSLTEMDIITVNIPSKIINGMYVILVTNSNGEHQGDKVFINR